MYGCMVGKQRKNNADKKQTYIKTINNNTYVNQRRRQKYWQRQHHLGIS